MSKIPRADDTKPRGPKPSKGGCECTNHMGTPKVKFRSRDAALRSIVQDHMWTGKKYRVYPCPTSSCFHIAGDGAFKKPRKA